MFSDYIDNDTAETLQRLASLDVKNKLLEAYVNFARDDEFPDEPSLLRWLNEQCGTNYKSGRWSDWKNGHRPIPAGVASQMRREILQCIFDDETADTLHHILALER